MIPYYYCRTQEKCEIALLDMFNNIVVNKYTDLDRKNFTKTMRVPIVIHQDKNFANWFRSVDHKRRAMPLPIGGLRYTNKQENSNNRTQATYARQIFSRATDQWIRDIQPTPYYLFYELEFLMDNKSDFGQITENIVPYFNTSRVLRIIEFDFAPDIERKIPVYLQSVSDTFEDEIEVGSKHRFIRTKFTFRLEVDWYRPFEIPEMIKYAELNYHIDDFMHKQQIFVYPDPIAQIEKKSWEQLTPSIRNGFTLLKTISKTLVKQVNINGNVSWENITTPDADRPVFVPSFNILQLNFDDDTSLEDDHSGFNRDFIALNDTTREFVPNVPPVTITNLRFTDGSINTSTNQITIGDNSRNTFITQNVVRFTSTGTLPTGILANTNYIIDVASSTGYLDTITLVENDGITPVNIISTNDVMAIHTLSKIGDGASNIKSGYESATSWNKILDWFGTDNGLHETSYTFQCIVQFKDDPVPDTIFQYLSNNEVLDIKGAVLIPEGNVFFDWGIIDSKLYFSFRTYGDNELFYTFTTKNTVMLNNTDIYKFVFISYDKGHAGIFGYTINDGHMIALDTDRE